MNVNDELSAHFVVFYNNGIYTLEYLVDAVVPKIVLLRMYDLCIRYQYFLPIELLRNEEKMELVDKLNETGLKFTNESKREAARILRTINFINQSI